MAPCIQAWREAVSVASACTVSHIYRCAACALVSNVRSGADHSGRAKDMGGGQCGLRRWKGRHLCRTLSRTALLLLNWCAGWCGASAADWILEQRAFAALHLFCASLRQASGINTVLPCLPASVSCLPASPGFSLSCSLLRWACHFSSPPFPHSLFLFSISTSMLSISVNLLFSGWCVLHALDVDTWRRQRTQSGKLDNSRASPAALRHRSARTWGSVRHRVA